MGYAYGLYHPYAYGHHVAAPAVAAPAPADLPAATAGVGGHPGGATSYSHRSPQGLRGKRSAEDTEAAAEEPAAAVAHVAVAHPYWGGYYGHQLGWASFRAPGFESTLWGGRLGKRSADAEPGYGYYGYPGYYRGYYGYPYGLGVAGHPTGTSYSHRSPQGLGK